MTENVPPGSASKAATSSADRPGLPYYEKLRRDLRDTLQKKRMLDRNLAAIEDQIYRQETSYLEETSAAGNIVKGFDNYIKASAVSASASAVGGNTISGSAAGGGGGGGVGGSAARRKAPVNEADRIFSKSSVSYNNNRGGDADTQPNSGVSTPNNPTNSAGAGAGGGRTGTPTRGFTDGSHGHSNNSNSNSNNNKKKKKNSRTSSTAANTNANSTNNNNNDEESDSRATKRQKISFGRKGHDD